MAVLKLRAKFESADGRRIAKVYRNSEWSEWTIKFTIDGEYQTEADSFESDFEEAKATALSFTTKGVIGA